jgi:hypothetical protein
MPMMKHFYETIYHLPVVMVNFVGGEDVGLYFPSNILQSVLTNPRSFVSYYKKQSEEIGEENDRFVFKLKGRNLKTVARAYSMAKTTTHISMYSLKSVMNSKSKAISRLFDEDIPNKIDYLNFKNVVASIEIDENTFEK